MLKKTVSVEGTSKRGHLEPTDKDSFRPAHVQPVGDVMESHDLSEERGQVKRLSDTTQQRTGKL